MMNAENSKQQQQQLHRPKKKAKRRPCYQCGEVGHRAKDCPEASAAAKDHLLQAAAAGPPPVDTGHFAAATAAATTTTTTDSSALASSSPSSREFTYVELFAGMGGFRLALDRLGGQCVFASEVDRFCVANYQRNFGPDRPAGDICRISSDSIPHHDICVGGFPCQPFSSSGSREGMDDDRGVLFREISRILKDKRPKGFLLENVRGLLLHNDGSTFGVIRGELERCGYVLSWDVVDAVALLPQERKRLYIVGVRSDMHLQYNFPVLPILPRGVEDVLHTCSGEDALSKEDVQRLVLSEHQISKVRSQVYTQKHPQARFLVDSSKPAKTLQSSYSKYMVGSQFVAVSSDDDCRPTCTNGENSVASHEVDAVKWRRFSSREAARMQGFPETFELCSQRAYHMIGNAVAPPIIAMLAAPLLQLLQLPSGKDDKNWGWKIAGELLLEAAPNDARRKDLQRKISDFTEI